ncbi:MAG: RNA polymerase sigma factor [candidate division WOR-3 bacterium]
MEAAAVSAHEARAQATPVSFENLYQANRSRVFGTALRMLGNRADAEDVTQDVFVKVFKRLDSFRGEAAITTWLYRITVNCCLDLLRRRKRIQTVPLESITEPVSDRIDVMKLIEAALPKMPEGYRQVFILHDLEGLKHSEIARILGISDGASKSQLHRARAYLRREIGPYLRALRRPGV